MQNHTNFSNKQSSVIFHNSREFSKFFVVCFFFDSYDFACTLLQRNACLQQTLQLSFVSALALKWPEVKLTFLFIVNFKNVFRMLLWLGTIV